MQYYKTTEAAGFRLDAIKHIDRKFMLHWVCHTQPSIFALIYRYPQIQETRRRAGLKGMFVVCESSFAIFS